jgi:predicted phosphodiesterase
MTEKSLSDKFEELVSPGPSGSDIKQTNTPEAWRPRMDVGKDGGYVVSTPRNAGEIPDAVEILAEFGLNAESWNVSSIRESRWQKFDGEWLQAFRVNLTPAFTSIGLDLDLEKLVDEIKIWKPSKLEKNISGNIAYLVAPSDQQIGKKANGEGTKESVARILNSTQGAVHRLHELRKIGRSVGTIVLALPGDHVEGNVSQHGRLQGLASSDLGLTEQTRVARRILMAQIKAFAPLCERLIVPVVNGNHDEVTRQVVADPSDGWNVEIASAVQDACAENPALSHVEFRFPAKGHQTLAIDICGTMLGLFHGHQSGRDVTKYLSGQAAGQTALGMCDVWVSGHFHNYKSMDIGERLWVQCPTTDPGSEWFRDRQGLESKPGVLTMVIGEDHDPRRDISIISASKD